MWYYTIQSIGSFETESKSDDSNDDDDDDDGDGSYLHPSLFATKKSSRLEEIMKVWLQTYAMLLRNINTCFWQFSAWITFLFLSDVFITKRPHYAHCAKTYIFCTQLT